MKKKKIVGEGLWNLEVLFFKFFYVWFLDCNMVVILVWCINWFLVMLLWLLFCFVWDI